MRYVTYTLQHDDRLRGLHGLANWFYGAPERWVELYNLNRHVIGDDPLALQPGQQLVISYNPPSDPLHIALYRVQADDYHHGLARIALRHFGDPLRAEQIYRINRGVIGEDPAQLQSGQLLIIPRSI